MKEVSLDDKYAVQEGRVYVTGPQALVRLPMMQIRRDRLAGLKTGGFISGYRGSPLGGYDMALWQAGKFLTEHDIHFQPGVNEDLAATAVWGSQQVEARGETDYAGVLGMWYGKGPGVDRSGDALKHGALAGASAHGGVLVLCGDDHAGRSSTTAHQSDHALVHLGIPILNPASIQEYLDFGLFGFALSRYSGCWVGFKCITDTVDGSASVCVDPERFSFVQPNDYKLPAGGLNTRIGLLGIPAEELMLERLEAAKAFVRANRLDKSFYAGGRKRLGIVSTGKAFLDVMEALSQLGIDEAEADRLGIAVYKVGMVWPLEPQRIGGFAQDCDAVLVIEEKRAIIEDQLARILYRLPSGARPILIGKQDHAGGKLVPSHGEINPMMIAKVVAGERLKLSSDPRLKAGLDRLEQAGAQGHAALSGRRELERVMSFCAGCPHNTSTRVPEGSIARPGIGCHGMVQWVPGRRTESNLTHMGGEGATWIGEAPFSKRRHIFQNLGDGTYFHSGLLAIRANVAAGTNITYKILVNGAISMTGGQVIEGESFNGGITAPHVANQVHAEGVQRIALVTEDLSRHDKSCYPAVTTFHHRDDLDAVQKEIREHPGTSVIIYEQACATERRRLRKRGRYPDIDKRLFINEEVCEGCGDCGVQSNCIAIEPNETKFGRKRKINQSVCNKDYSCVKGMCPSFVTVYGGALRAADSKDSVFDDSVFADLPDSWRGATPEVCNIMIAGIGGSGIVTLGAILGMAAHMEERACNVLDVTGAAQRNGPVTSHLRIGAGKELRSAPRIPEISADVILAADLVVASGRDVLPTMSSERTAAVYNSYVAPTAAFAQNADLSFSTEAMEQQIAQRCRSGQTHAVPATQVATQILGNAVGANIFLLGAAWQRGLIPLSLAAIEKAIRLNGTEVKMNTRAFGLGRLSVAKPETLAALMRAREVKAPTPDIGSLDSLIADRRQLLTQYQNKAYADRYEALVRKVAKIEKSVVGTEGQLAEVVARYYAKLLAYKDEYEVARLMTREEFFAQLEKTFEGDYRLAFNLAPPLLSRRDPATGRYGKREFGAWILTFFKILAPLKVLRGTPFDIFGYMAHRRCERRLIADYEQMIDDVLNSLAIDNLPAAIELASLPEIVRGYDVVKDAHIEEMKARREELIRELRKSPAERSGPRAATGPFERAGRPVGADKAKETVL
jgi:indolepyruvate ferredoxin oxidoreductase